MRILAIETSCDDTSAAVVQDGRRVLSNVISSQIDFHQKFGGVVPEIASRKHLEAVELVIQEALDRAEMTFDNVDGIGVTYGPGLIGALLVGLSSAKAIALAIDKPLIGVHHIEGHISANYIADQSLTPPFLCLVVSGGHTYIVEVEDYCKYRIIGKTHDDAAGEAFDKVARTLGLGYPGGPAIEKRAALGRAIIEFPKPVIRDHPYDFSFSGLKTAVLNYINTARQKGQVIPVEDIAASFQKAVVDVLVDKAINAALEYNIGTIAVAGGVAANGALKETMDEACRHNGLRFIHPQPILCTDNAAMIGSAAFFRWQRGYISDLFLNAEANIPLQ